MKIALLGLGQMGSGIAGCLLRGKQNLTVWNRTSAATGPLVDGGAAAAATAAEAVSNADIVFTMLTDDDATRDVVLGQQGFIESLKPDAVHVTLGTISVELARAITDAHHQRGQEHVGSPVFGRPQVAAEGKLWLATAGMSAVIDRIRPVLENFSRGLSVVGERPWQAHALKLGGNFMITSTIQMMAEAFVYAEAQEIDPATFIETINSALFQSAFIANYAKTMLHPPEKPGATVALGIKDTRLFREAAGAKGLTLGLADYLADRLDKAKAAGWEEEDWAVGQFRVAQQ